MTKSCRAGSFSIIQNYRWGFALLIFILSLPVTAVELATPGSAMVIELPGEVQGRELIFTLDDFDISAFVQVGLGSATFIPLQPLAPGVHQITVFSVEDDQLVSVAVEFYQVLNESEVQRQFIINGDLNLSQRLDERTDSGLQSFVADGALTFNAGFQSSDWSIDASGVVLGNNNDFLQTQTGIDNRDINPSDYLITARRGNTTARFGYHQQSQRSLVMQNFRRRGASVGWRPNARGLTTDLFIYEPDESGGSTLASNIGLGSEDVYGGSFRYQTDSALFQSSELGFTWLRSDGDGSLNGQQQAMSAVASSRLFNQRLLVRAELAKSKQDVVSTEIEDDAHELTLIYTPAPILRIDSSAIQLESGLNWRQVGTFFTSPAHPGLLNDIDSTEWFVRSYNREWSFDAALQRQDTNVSNLSALPVIRTNSQSLTLTYSPQPDTDTVPKEFRQSIISASWLSSDQSQISTATENQNSADNQTNQILLNVGQYGDQWSWNIGASMGRFEDRSGLASSNRNHSVSVFLGYRASNRFSIDFSGQTSQFELDSTGQVTDSNFIAASTIYALIPARLDGFMRYSYGRDDSNTATQISESKTFGAGLNWIIRPSSVNHIGTSVWIKGEWVDREGSTIGNGLSDNNYLILVGLSINFNRNRGFR